MKQYSTSIAEDENHLAHQEGYPNFCCQKLSSNQALKDEFDISTCASSFNFSKGSVHSIFSVSSFSESKLGLLKTKFHTSVQKTLFQKRVKQFVDNALETSRTVVVGICRVASS